jgi:hypothetical protein
VRDTVVGGAGAMDSAQVDLLDTMPLGDVEAMLQ